MQLGKFALCAVLILALSVPEACIASPINQGRTMLTNCNETTCDEYFSNGSFTKDGRYLFAIVSRYKGEQKGLQDRTTTLGRLDLKTKELKEFAVANCDSFPRPITKQSARNCETIQQISVAPNRSALTYSVTNYRQTFKSDDVTNPSQFSDVLISSKVYLLNLSNNSVTDLTLKYSLRDDSSSGIETFWHANSSGVFLHYSAPKNLAPYKYIDFKTGRIVSKKTSDFYVRMSPNGKFGITAASLNSNGIFVKNISTGKIVTFKDLSPSWNTLVFDDGLTVLGTSATSGLVLANASGKRTEQSQMSYQVSGGYTLLSDNKTIVGLDSSSVAAISFQLSK